MHRAFALIALLEICAANCQQSYSQSTSESSLLYNGGFELTPCGDPQSCNYPAGTNLESWTVEGASVEVNTGRFNAACGSKSLDLSTSSIAQTVQTIPGQVYDLSFMLSSGPRCCGVTLGLAVEFWWSSEQRQTIIFKTSSAEFSRREVSYTAPDSSVTIRFKSLTGPECGPVIDCVSLEQASTGNFSESSSVLYNGGFELTPCDLPSCNYLAGANLGSWTVERASVEVNTARFTAACGSKSLDLSTSDIAQTVQTIPGQVYGLSFMLSSGLGCSGSTLGMNVEFWWANERRQTIIFQTSSAEFSERKAYFIAPDSSVTIHFVSLTGPQCGPIIDCVAFSPLTSSSTTSQPIATTSTIEDIPIDGSGDSWPEPSQPVHKSVFMHTYFFGILGMTAGLLSCVCCVCISRRRKCQQKKFAVAMEQLSNVSYQPVPVNDVVNDVVNIAAQYPAFSPYLEEQVPYIFYPAPQEKSDEVVAKELQAKFDAERF
eukprot:TRINITY_DN1575_c0_g1_i2.p1 TRINITY_DN1575_c0_g1~~TRINITY_DN1575_c0_g1_i2.p1  ORF type:complete len:488 (+),score=69.98 TRINITY_DN1575_c0_g1_i2:173-1636(+)